jgi:hypothetical protein
MVFVEMMLNNKTAKNIAALCRELSSLTSIEKWEFSVRGEDDSRIIALSDIQHELADSIQSLVESWLPDNNASVNVYEHHIEIKSLLGELNFQIADYGDSDSVVARNKLNERPINFNKYLSDSFATTKNILGESWQVDCIDDLMLAYRLADNKLLLIKPHGF